MIIFQGNIRVFCRVRPLLPDEISSCGSDQSPDHMQFPADGATLELEKIASIDPSEVIIIKCCICACKIVTFSFLHLTFL